MTDAMDTQAAQAAQVASAPAAPAPVPSLEEDTVRALGASGPRRHGRGISWAASSSARWCAGSPPCCTPTCGGGDSPADPVLRERRHAAVRVPWRDRDTRVPRVGSRRPSPSPCPRAPPGMPMLNQPFGFLVWLGSAPCCRSGWLGPPGRLTAPRDRSLALALDRYRLRDALAHRVALQDRAFALEDISCTHDRDPLSDEAISRPHRARQAHAQVDKGDIFGFIGPNGAGKTHDDEDPRRRCSSRPSGQARSAASRRRSDGDFVRRNIGYMPDFFGVYEDLTVNEYLEFFAGAYGIPGRRAQKRSSTTCSSSPTSRTRRRPGRDPLARHAAAAGPRARARARPRVLLLDEPASGLDPRARIEIRELLKELRAWARRSSSQPHPPRARRVL